MACERPPRSLRSRLPLTRGELPAAAGGRSSTIWSPFWHTDTDHQQKTACQNNVDTESIAPIFSRTSQYCMQFI
jgi:hypothetical protein